MMNGLNIDFPIYYDDVNGIRTSFHGMVLKKAVVDGVVMSLSDKITGDIVYNGSDLQFTMQEYVLYNDVKYSLVNPPTVVREGLVADNSDLKGATRYSFEFYHPMYMLSNFPFTDVAVSFDEIRYKSHDKVFSWIGKPLDYVNKLNKNLEGTEFVVVLSSSVAQSTRETLSEVLTFDNSTIADALKTGYDTWGLPYVVDKLERNQYSYTTAQYPSGRDYYDDGKRFVILFGLPANEIYENETQKLQGIPFVFQFGQGVGLKNNSRTPRNNKIVTRIAGYGSETNIPYGYPQIIWYGDPEAEFTYGDRAGVFENVTINGQLYPKVVSYPIYEGIVGGEYVKLIKHPFTRNHLMPSVYYDTIFKKVSPYYVDGGFHQDYDPDIEIVDYYDAVGSDYPNNINLSAPSYAIHEFADIKPELGEANILGANPINADLTDADGWDDTMDDDGNYLQSYFKITLPELSFDIYACAAITEEMQINMRSGACIGCTFTVQVDWDDYKRNFYDSDMNFAPHGEQRDYTKYPDSSQGSISVIVQKDNNTFGTLMPNIYQNPAAGDAFVVLGISLPFEYITDAQQRLDAAMKSYMLENNVYYFDYPLKFDEHFLANRTYILNQIRPNTIIRFRYNDEELELFVKQLTIKYHESVLPKYDITLTDDVEIVLNQIGQVADDVEKLGTLIALLRQQYGKNVLIELAKKLSRVDNDIAQGLISFAQGWETLGFFSNNFLGYGAKVNQRGVGEFEEINIRGALRAAELVFNKISAEEGESLRSIGHGEILTVTETSETTGIATLKLDGNEWATIGTEDICRGLYNTINKGYDNAQAEGFDGNGFRLKAGFFASYFEITSVTSSKGECSFTYRLQENTTEHPCPLMKFAVYGNFNRLGVEGKKKRQSCMYITAVGIAPRLLFLAGVDDWQIRPQNIKAVLGNLDGLQVYEKTDNGIELKTLHGDAGLYVEDNIYLGGAIEQFIHANLDEILAELGQGIHAQLLRGSDNIVVDALGNIVGGIYETFTDGTSVVKRYKLHTGVLVYDSGAERYLGQDEFTISYVTDGCDVLRDGNDFYITNIHNTNDGLSETVLTDDELTLMRNTEQCGINFVITTNNGWKTQMSYPIKLTHLDTAYITFQLNNEFDSISYRSQLSQYDGLPVTTAIEAYVNGERLNDLTSITINSDLFDAPITINTESESQIATIEHECGLDITISLDGSLTITRHSQNGTETDLEDAKHQFYISAVAKYAGINYESGIKTFTLQEITDSTLYKLLLSATAISKDSGIFTPSTIDVKVQVNDNDGVNVYTAAAFNQRGTTRVRYINGVYSQSAVLLETMPSLTDQTTCITVLVVDLANPSSPVILDTQSITINAVGRDGAGQPYVKTNVDSFTIDCDANGVPLTSVPDLIVDAELYWGDGKCALNFGQCYLKYKGVAYQLEYGQLSESVTARISINSSDVLTSSNIEIYLIGSKDGETHSAVKTIPVVANRQGASGGTGRGVVSIVTYYKKSTEFEGIVPPSENVNPTTAGWSETRIDATESEPYLWRFTRITYTSNPTVEQSDAELIYVWQDIVNPNLLEDTEFFSLNDMGAWHDVGQLWSNGSGDANTVKDANVTPIFRPVNTYNQGYNQFYSRYKATDNYGDNSGKGYINIMSQYVNRPSTGIAKIEAGKWYTLSFYMYGSKGNSSYDTNPFQLACSVVHVADVSEGVYVNGTRTSSGYCNFVFEDNSFVRKTITFKTKSDLSEDMYVCWQMYVREYTQEIWICKPKLEAGQTATDYRPMRNVDEPIARTSTWEAGKQYYQGRKGEPYVDIVSRYGTWYRCQVTHVSKGGNSDNGPIEGSSSTNWERSNKFGFVATDLLLADQAVINLLFSQKILMTDSQNRLTASINADEHGSYCIYYPSGNRRMMFSYDGYIRYYNDDDGSIAWTLGHGGDITKGSSDDWALFPLHKLVGTESSDFTEDSKFNLTNYWQFHSGSGGHYSPYDGNIYTSKPNDRNPATATLISDGFYTPNYMPFQEITDGGVSVPAITVYTISNGAITSTTTLRANTNS